jgi:hypothetical protein
MRNEIFLTGPGGQVSIMDSITKVGPGDKGSIVVSGSHGGVSSGEFALAVPLKLVFFNDAGIGKDNAGIAALGMLQDRSIAAGTVAHHSARIGDALDAWDNGTISAVNAAAAQLGLSVGQQLKYAISRLVNKP